MYPALVPTATRRECRIQHVDHLEGWKDFAERITKHPFVKTFLLQRDGIACSWCTKTMHGQTIIHHISYDHFCTYGKHIRVLTPTATNPHKSRLVPDCGNCGKNNHENFINCMRKLALVHPSCNREISDGAALDCN